MKATGIVRRIDDLGRIVIPKEIRRTLRIREGDPLEIFVDREGEVILKKYSPISELGHFATEYTEALFDTLHYPVLICDRDEIIALAGMSKTEFLNKQIGSNLEQVMEERKPILESEPMSSVEVKRGQEEELSSFCISPIIASGDPIGCVMMYSKDESMGEAAQAVTNTAASFLAKQME